MPRFIAEEQMRKLHELEALLESSDNLSPITLGMSRKNIILLLFKNVTV